MGGFADYAAELDSHSQNGNEGGGTVLPFPEPDSAVQSPNTSGEFKDPSFTKLKSGKYGVKTKNLDVKKGDTITVYRRDGGVSDVVLGKLIKKTKFGERIFSLEKKSKD